MFISTLKTIHYYKSNYVNFMSHKIEICVLKASEVELLDWKAKQFLKLLFPEKLPNYFVSGRTSNE